MISDLIKNAVKNPTIKDAVALGIANTLESLSIKHWSEIVSPIGIFASTDICFRMQRTNNHIIITLIKARTRNDINHDVVLAITIDERLAEITIEQPTATSTRIPRTKYTFADPQCSQKTRDLIELLRQQLV